MKKSLCVLALALAVCTSLFSLSSIPAHAATHSVSSRLAPLNVHGGGCTNPAYPPIEACIAIGVKNGAPNLYADYYRLSWPSNCDHIMINMYDPFGLLEAWGFSCSNAHGVMNLGSSQVGSGLWFQATATMMFTDGTGITAWSQVQYT